MLSLAVFSPTFAQSTSTSSTDLNVTTQALIKVLTQLLQQLELQLQTLLAERGNNTNINMSGGNCSSGQTWSGLNGGCISQTQNQSSSITVTSPNDGDSLVIGQSYQIKWIPNSTKVNIFLNTYDQNGNQIGNGQLQWIAQAIDNTGIYNWTPSTSALTLSTAYKYKIRITKANDLSYGVSDMGESAGFFTLRNSSTQNQPFTITFPTQGASLQAGQTYNVSWTGSDTNVNSYAVYLSGGKLGSNGSSFIGTAYPRGAGNVGTFSWAIPADLTSASNYQIQFSGAGATGGNSGTFSISGSTQNQPSITINSPGSGKMYNQGDTLNISWIANGVSGVGLGLDHTDGTFASIIAVGLPTSGNYSWQIPSNFPTGSYVIVGSVNNNGNLIYSNGPTISIGSAQNQTVYPPNIESVGSSANPANSFYPGDNVKIVGSNFPQNPTIMIGNAYVLGQTNSSGMNINFIAPSLSAGTYSLSIAAKGGGNTVQVTVLSR